ncbi:MAG: pyruvate formate lyase-activating enzyme 1 [Methanoregula sp. PtaU1.Bin051]|nr:MAG: pyruvate formate lyase-activating enzyme 1 [Methanoregula sp. PtaU1.Bin051]
MVFIRVNFGGFIPLSTVDWRGRSVCTVFLRGCPLQCSYCQNEAIQAGEDFRTTDEIIDLIKDSAKFISGVVFSGGEPTLQKDALLELSGRVRKMNLAVGIHTNGFYPETLKTLIGDRLVDKVAIDYKTRWEGFSNRWEGFSTVRKSSYVANVRKSISLCRRAFVDRILPELEVVVTVFPGNEQDAKAISDEIGNLPLVLQQGEHKIGNLSGAAIQITHGQYMNKKSVLKETHPPLTIVELKELADTLKRPVRIRTRSLGELEYEGNRSRRTSRKR